MPTPLSQEQSLPPSNHWLSNLETDWEFRNRGTDFSIHLVWWSISFVNFACYCFLMPRKLHHPVTCHSPPTPPWCPYLSLHQSFGSCRSPPLGCSHAKLTDFILFIFMCPELKTRPDRVFICTALGATLNMNTFYWMDQWLWMRRRATY